MPAPSLETRRLRAISDLLPRLIAPVDQRSLFDQALIHSADLLGASAGTVRLLDRAGFLTCAATYGAPEGYLDRHVRFKPEARELHYALDASGPVSFGPELAHPSMTGLAPEGFGGSILAPIVLERQVLGLLTLLFPERRELDDGDFLALKALTEFIAVGELNARSYANLERTSRTDALTGLATRRHFEELLRRELARARRQERPLSLAMLDVDRLKWINDTFGHVTGDRVIARVGDLLKDSRVTDVPARLGGDEFAVLMPDTSACDAEGFCARFRERLAEVNARREFPFPLSVSMGVREMAFPEEDLVAAADAAMYVHKRLGRAQAAPAVEEEEEAERPYPV